MNKHNLIKALVDKMLEKHGVNYDYVIANPVIEGENWFSYYTFTPKEEEEYKAWAVPLIKKNLKIPWEWAEKEFDGFNLYCGLKVNYETT